MGAAARALAAGSSPASQRWRSRRPSILEMDKDLDLDYCVWNMMREDKIDNALKRCMIGTILYLCPSVWIIKMEDFGCFPTIHVSKLGAPSGKVPILPSCNKPWVHTVNPPFNLPQTHQLSPKFTTSSVALSTSSLKRQTRTCPVRLSPPLSSSTPPHWPRQYGAF